MIASGVAKSLVLKRICWYFIDVMDYVDDEIDVINDYDVSYSDNKNC